MDNMHTASDAPGDIEALKMQSYRESIKRVYKDYLLKLTPRLRDIAARNIFDMSFNELKLMVDNI